MSKEKLLKINDEYKLLKSLQFGYYFRFNKSKIFWTTFFSIFVLLLVAIFMNFIKDVYIPEWTIHYNKYLIYITYYLVSFLSVFSLVSIVYINIYSAYQYTKQRKTIKNISFFHKYEDYIEYMTNIKIQANEILRNLKNE